jgi:uncharacterized iron-regulated membrane protein
MLASTKIRIWCCVHRWTSLICTVFLLLLCLTGLPLIFRDEIDAVIGDDISVPVLPAGTAAAPLDRVVEAAQQRYPGEYVQFFVWDLARPELIKLTMAPVPNAKPELFHRLFIDARTTQVLGEPTSEKVVTRFLVELHGEMFLGLPGGLFLGAMGLVFVAAIVSGAVLYGPFMRRLDFGAVRTERRRGRSGSICTICSASSRWPGC